MTKLIAVLFALTLIPAACFAAGWDSVEVKNLPEQITAGEEILLDYEVTYYNEGTFTIEWSTSDPDVLSYSEGYVKAISPGTATLTATLRNGSRSFNVEVTPAD